MFLSFVSKVDGETELADENGVSIAPFCTHMLLVDDGRHRHFAADLNFLAALERQLVHLGGSPLAPLRLFASFGALVLFICVRFRGSGS